ncbi:MAG TPA: VTT domain-containing protein [Candidatus Acidoferrales bacterium]|nr:VTT domain-containing protein [Candidatus Acidoferrales bacterium]
MLAPKLPGWLARAIASFGGAGLLVVAFLDSSVLSFPFVTDLLVIEFSIHRGAFMLFYAAMATLGSLAGCIWLYLLGKKGGEAYYRRREHQSPGKIRLWVSDHAFLSVFVPALFPPPIPYKAFVIAEGVFQIPLRTFILGVLAGRGLRFLVEGLLAVRYGAATETFLFAHKVLLVSIPVALSIVALVVSHYLFRAARNSASS